MHHPDLLFRTLQLRPVMADDEIARAWRAMPARGLASLAEYEGGATWILRRLRETGADQAAEAGLLTALSARAREGAARSLLVDAEAVSIVTQLQQTGLACVLLKGSGRRAAGDRWPYADARPTSDVDLILSAEDAPRAWALLNARGYIRPSDALSPHQLPALTGPAGIAIDLHTSTGHRLPPGEAWRRANDRPIDCLWSGLSVRVPNATEMLWHGLVHALQHGIRAWRLRFLLDGASILVSQDAVEWPLIAARLETDEVPDAAIARGWLAAAALLAGTPASAPLTGATRPFHVARMLRWRTAVLARWGYTGFGGRLLDEGTRVELGLGPTPNVAATRFRRVRRSVATGIARPAYALWRALAAA